MSYDAKQATYQEVTILGKPALFTECRLDRTTVPEGVYRYEMRHADEDWGEPITLSRSILVNYCGTVLTREPFQLPVEGWIPLASDSLSFQDGGCRTLANFSRNTPSAKRMSSTFTASMMRLCTTSISHAARSRTRPWAALDICGAILAAVGSSFSRHGGLTKMTR